MTHLFYSRSTEDLMATLSIWDTTHHKVIHGMVWQVEPDRFKLDDPQSVIGKFQRNDLTEDLWLDRPNWNQDYYVLILSSPHRTIPVVPDKPKKVENFHFTWFQFGPSSQRSTVKVHMFLRRPQKFEKFTFDVTYLVSFKKIGRFFQIFVTYSE